MEAALADVFGATDIELDGWSGPFVAKANLLDLGRVGFGFRLFPVDASLRYPADGLIRFLIGLVGSAEVRTRRSKVTVTAFTGCFTSAHDEAALRVGAGCEQLEVRIRESALLELLADLVGIRPRGPIEFEPLADLARPELQAIRRLVMFLAGEFNVAEPRIPDAALAEFADMFLISLLHAQRHGLSHLLERDSGKALPWQVRRIEEYIVANWNRPLAIRDLATLTGASVRSIFKAFRQSRGYSPMEFARRTRLEHARTMLAAPEDKTSVAGVANACGFGNLGHFAAYYQRAFGERPSETLRRGRGVG